ncbi:MAG: replication-associated recombination protein A [Candidatus Omnitrophica bacterium]|jgi:putative ATPase|nr:replication-associated recombination protein A [Candidatus Omnitrophota bacterium]
MQKSEFPLAVRLRPEGLDEFVGQKQVLGQDKLLRRAIIAKRISSLILWGPVGSGKTSLGFIIAKELEADFEYLNAAFSSVGALKKIIEKAKKKTEEGKKTVIFLDEIHKFNKLQQEILVPDTETSRIILIGATIYNPYYYIIPSLISRSLVTKFEPLGKEEIVALLKRALKDNKRGLGSLNLKVTTEALEYLAVASGGDARSALSALEIGALSIDFEQQKEAIFDLGVAKECIQKKNFYDRKDTYHYDTISAFIKSIRGSDVDSALYWLAKMLKSGEDPRFIARRLVILASEDIGNANPFALVLATSCFKAVEFVGLPEANLILAQATIYLAASDKSNASYLAIKTASDDVEKEETKQVPPHLKTHAKDYKYPHDFGGYVEQNYGVVKKYYFPKAAGEEKRIKDFLDLLHRKDIN